jgi:putative intracellular protease/amidase
VVAPGPHHAAAYLVRNEERPAFESALAGFVEAHPDVTVVCTGPWAPYTFAEATS